MSNIKRVAGLNQFRKLLRHGKAIRVYLANDADGFFASEVRRELTGKGIPLDESKSSSELAATVGVEVPTAVVTEAYAE